MTSATVAIRDARDDDDWDLVGLIAACWAEYPGCIMDVHGEAPELLAIATHYERVGGRFWVAEDAGRVVACIGVRPLGQAAAELCKLYVARGARRRGLGARLVALVEGTARSGGARRVELWSDTRFADAHRLYARLGYRSQPETRELHDLSRSVECHYVKEL